MKTKLTASVTALLLTSSLLLAGCTGDSVSTSGGATSSAPASSGGSTTSDPSSKPGTSPIITVPADADLKTLADAIYGNISGIKFPTLITDELDLSDQNRFRYIFGIDPPASAVSALVSEPMIGSIPYTMALLKLSDTTDIESITISIGQSVDPAKWICVSASVVKTTHKGNVILMIMDKDADRADAVVDSFLNTMD